MNQPINMRRLKLIGQLQALEEIMIEIENELAEIELEELNADAREQNAGEPL